MARMKKTRGGQRKSPAKGKTAARSRGANTFEEYLARVPEAARGNFDKLRAAVLAAVPAEAVETISYGIPAIRYGKVAVWYAAFAEHCSLFPTAAVIDAFKGELKGYTTSKGTIQFPVDKPLPSSLVKKMVKARLARLEGSEKTVNSGGGRKR
jgi:uncharacterized protein YdhG (YjbR/CyaY superfamily)